MRPQTRQIVSKPRLLAAVALLALLPNVCLAQYPGLQRRVTTDSLRVRAIAQFDSTARFLDAGVTPFTVVSNTKVTNLNADLLDGQTGTWYVDSGNFTGTDWDSLTDGGDTNLHRHDSRYYTQTELDGGELDDRYYTETEIDSRVISDLVDVDDTGRSLGDVIMWNGTVWADSLLVGITDHGDLTGLDDNDHGAIYFTETESDARFSPIAGSASIVTVGTIGTGVWQGTAVSEGYLDHTWVSTFYLGTLDLGTNTITDGNLTGAWTGITNLTATGIIQAASLTLVSNEPDVIFSDTGAVGYTTLRFQEGATDRFVIGKTDAGNFYISPYYGAAWHNDAFVVDVTNSNISMAASLTVGGTVQAEHLYSTDDAVIDNRLSIGTATPAYQLHVHEGSSGTAAIKVTNTTTGITTTDGLSVGVLSDERVYFKNYETTDILFESSGGDFAFTGGNVGIGTTAPERTLDVLSTTDYGQIMLTRSKTDAQIQRVGLTAQHYTAAEENVGLIAGYFPSGENRIMIGGGSSLMNAATSIVFYTAANTTTQTGTARLTIASDGRSTFTGALYIPEYLYHAGDTDTYLRFQTDNVRLVAGGDAVITGYSTGTDINYGAHADVTFFKGATTGENPYVYTYGYDTGASAVRYGKHQVATSGAYVITAQEALNLIGTTTATLEAGTVAAMVSAAGQDMIFDLGGTAFWRDVDAANATRMSLASATGDLMWTGALNHDGSTAGFFGVTPITRPDIEEGSLSELIDALVLLGLITYVP